MIDSETRHVFVGRLKLLLVAALRLFLDLRHGHRNHLTSCRWAVSARLWQPAADAAAAAAAATDPATAAGLTKRFALPHLGPDRGPYQAQALPVCHGGHCAVDSDGCQWPIGLRLAGV